MWSACSADCGQGTSSPDVSCSLGTDVGCGLEERSAEEVQCDEDVGCGTELEAVFVVTGCTLCCACLVGCVSWAYSVRHKLLSVNVENPVALEDFVVPGTAETHEEVHVPWNLDPTDLAGSTRVDAWTDGKRRLQKNSENQKMMCSSVLSFLPERLLNTDFACCTERQRQVG